MTTVGKLNAYDCPVCKKVWITVEIHIGIPATRILCRENGCKGLCESRNYQNIPFGAEPTHEFYRMSRAEARRQDREHSGTFKYHKRGGLGLRRRRKDVPIRDGKVAGVQSSDHK